MTFEQTKINKTKKKKRERETRKEGRKDKIW